MTEIIHTVVPDLFKKFHAPFKGVIPYELFSYLVVGAINTGANIFLFYLLYYYCFEPLYLGGYFKVLLPYSSALFLAFILSAPLGYWMQRKFVFFSNSGKKVAQFTKYLYVGLQAMIIDYFLLHLLIEYFGLEPIIAKIISTVLVVGVTFLIQKYFTFRT